MRNIRGRDSVGLTRAKENGGGGGSGLYRPNLPGDLWENVVRSLLLAVITAGKTGSTEGSCGVFSCTLFPLLRPNIKEFISPVPGVLGVFCEGEDGLGPSNNKSSATLSRDTGECLNTGLAEVNAFPEGFWDISDTLGTLLLGFVIKLLFRGKFLTWLSNLLNTESVAVLVV